jgi:group I intron endonuclease
MNQSPGIYRLKMEMGETSRVYIGQSVNIRERILSHLSSLKGNRHPNKFLQRAYNKYGDCNLKIEILEYLDTKDEETLTAAETFWIAACKSLDPKYGFNLKEAGPSGVLSPEIRKQISEKLKGRPLSPENIAKRVATMTGTKRDSEILKRGWETRRINQELKEQEVLKLNKISKINLISSNFNTI